MEYLRTMLIFWIFWSSWFNQYLFNQYFMRKKIETIFILFVKLLLLYNISQCWSPHDLLQTLFQIPLVNTTCKIKQNKWSLTWKSIWTSPSWHVFAVFLTSYNRCWVITTEEMGLTLSDSRRKKCLRKKQLLLLDTICWPNLFLCYIFPVDRSVLKCGQNLR